MPELARRMPGHPELDWQVLKLEVECGFLIYKIKILIIIIVTGIVLFRVVWYKGYSKIIIINTPVMPIKQSAKKYMRVTERRTKQNNITRGLFRSAIKKTRVAIGAKNIEDARKWFMSAQKFLDKATKKGVIKKNTASRLKSRLNAAVKNISK